MTLSNLDLKVINFENYINTTKELDKDLIIGYFCALALLPKKQNSLMKPKQILSNCVKHIHKLDQMFKQKKIDNNKLKEIILENNKLFISYIDSEVSFESIKSVFTQFKINL